MAVSGTQKACALLPLAIAMIAGFGGCQSLRSPTVFSRLAKPADEKVKFEQPHRMAIIWKESSMPTSPTRKPTRGFGGRVYFYNAADEPVRVDGELVVYAFNDSGSDDSQTADKPRTPERKYVFRASELQQHFSQTKIGPSYSVWVPWDEVGGEQVNVSLLPMFKPVDGQIINSGQSLAILPGKSADRNRVEYRQAEINTILRASADVPDGAIDTSPIESRIDNSGKRRPTTINVPRGLARQIRESTPPDAPAAVTSKTATPRAAIADPANAEPDELSETAKQLYQRLGNEAARYQSAIQPERQPVFGSPGPVR
jgi:hypothetical protein